MLNLKFSEKGNSKQLFVSEIISSQNFSDFVSPFFPNFGTNKNWLIHYFNLLDYVRKSCCSFFLYAYSHVLRMWIKVVLMRYSQEVIQ